MSGQTYEILTLSDIVQVYAMLPAERGELMLGEIADAVRMMAPLVGIADLTGPLRWVDDDKGQGTVKFVSGSEGASLGSVTVALKEGAA
nr:hypothetical protein [uncultured Brevundimonas sp.]